jgi:phytol kinase
MAVVIGKSGASLGRQSIGRLVQDRVGPTELRRRAHHILPGFLSLLLWVIPHPHPWIVTASVAAVIVAAAVWTFVRFDCIQRDREGRNDCIVAVAGYSGSILVTLFLFAPHLEVAFLVLGVLAFGDGSATLGGMLFGYRQLPWNPKKTVVGTACFLLIGAPMAAVLYWGEAQAHWTGAHGLAFHSHPTALAVALAMALMATGGAAIAESLPSRTNDNLRVGLVAAIAASLMQLLLVGWA